MAGIIYKVIGTRFLTEDTFVVRFNRGDLQFRAGQKLVVGLKDEIDQREYSIYSSEKENFLEILVKEVTGGNVSVRLKKASPGQVLQVNGPFGSFTIEEFNRYNSKFIFIATGTGISPFHSFVRSYPGLDYLLIHGVRIRDEAYEKENYKSRYVLCTSGEVSERRKGRVTDYLKDFRTENGMLFYLCGNGSMIYDASHILKDKGVPPENIFSEIYF